MHPIWTCADLACRAQQQATVVEGGNGAAPAEGEPTPVVKIDNQHDPFATVVSVQFGDRLGELLDTVWQQKHRCITQITVHV